VNQDGGENTSGRPVCKHEFEDFAGFFLKFAAEPAEGPPKPAL